MVQESGRDHPADCQAAGRRPKAIAAEVERLTPLVEAGGFVPHCDHRVPADVPRANYIHYVKEGKRVWGKGLANLRSVGSLRL
ncbi:MAG TPA: hypothetical protein VFH53_08635 [Phycisphaerae bacterium]|nr:hypothetical protein [Phycisphaerae bacterium]